MNKVSNVSFNRNDTDVENIAPSLAGAIDWTPNQSLSIITGVNGSGKSQLMKYLSIKNNESLYLDPYDKLDNLDILPWVVEAVYFKMMTKVSDKSKYVKDFENTVCSDTLGDTRFKCDDVDNKLFKHIITEKQQQFDLTHPGGVPEIDYTDSFNDTKAPYIRKRPTILNSTGKFNNENLEEFENILDECLNNEFHRNSLAHLVHDHITKRDDEILIQFNKDLVRAGSSICLRIRQNSITNKSQIDLLCNEVEVTTKDLSSGERLIVSMLARKNINIKAKVMLLDEPDKHLDPKLCKLFMKVIRDVFLNNGIQVIMTTHRLDTVALSTDNELFVIEKKRNDSTVVIRPIHRILAMAKLSRNAREFVGFHAKVYTESYGDSIFYRNIYRLLIAKEEKEPLITEGRLLSLRWMPEFHSVCFHNKGGGGKTIIAPLIIREHAFYNQPTSLGSSLYPPIVLVPFALLDDDWGDGSKTVRKNLKQHCQELFKRFTFLKRHSLENYLYDPFLLSSIITEETSSRLIRNKELAEVILELGKYKTEDEFRDDANRFFKLIHKSLENLPKMEKLEKLICSKIVDKEVITIDDENRDELFIALKRDITKHYYPDKILVGNFIRDHWNVVCDKLSNEDSFVTLSDLIYNMLSYNITDLMRSTDFTILEDKIKNCLRSNYENIIKVEIPRADKAQMINDSRIPQHDVRITLVGGGGKLRYYDYPAWFLNARGHDLESVFTFITGDTYSSPTSQSITDSLQRNNMNNMRRGINSTTIRYDPDEDKNATVDTYSSPKSQSFTDSLLDILTVTDRDVCIPGDLVEVMNDLSNKIRGEINTVTKKYDTDGDKNTVAVNDRLLQKKWVDIK